MGGGVGGWEVIGKEGRMWFVERGISAVECRTSSPGSNPLCCHFRVWAFSFSPRHPSSISCINEYLAI